VPTLSVIAGPNGSGKSREKAGYRTFLVYMAFVDPELHIERVRLRASQGGHDIPDVDIRRRYARSLIRAPAALRLVDEAVVLDNSGLHPVRMLLLRREPAG
jgi:predicted ABC-type ATPase